MKAALKPIMELLTTALNFFYAYVGNYGIAIVLLTIVVRVILLPLTIKQTKAMRDMQKIQPKLRALQQKYKNDKEKLQKEMLKFYSEHKVNPLGGCLPLLLQFPVMIALFWTLLDYEPLKEAVFLGMNLGKAAGNPLQAGFWSPPHLIQVWPYVLLVLLMMVTTYLPQKMLSTDAQQNRMMLFMTIFMAYIGCILPAGVLIYWLTTNIWTIGQQYVTLRSPEASSGG